MSFIEIFFILLIHWIADFIFQDEKWSIGKSKNNSDLIKHTLTYSLVWFIAIFLWTLNLGSAIYFTILTWLFHTITDWITSRIVSKKFEQKRYGSTIPNFEAFTIIGLDQLIHYIQLFLTYGISL